MALRTISAMCRRKNASGFKLSASSRKDRSVAAASLRPLVWSNSPIAGGNIHVQKRYNIQTSQRNYDIVQASQASAEADKLFQSGEIEKAAAVLRDAIAVLCPDPADSISTVRHYEQWTKLSEIYSIQQRWADARGVFSHLVNAVENVIASQEDKRAAAKLVCQKEGRAFETDETYNHITTQIDILNSAAMSLQHDLAGAHEKLREFEDAQKFYKRSLERAEANGNDMFRANVAAALGLLYDKVGNHKEAEKYHIQALKLNPITERWDHPHYATSLHPHHQQPKLLTVDQVVKDLSLKLQDDTCHEKHEHSSSDEFIVVDDSPSSTRQKISETLQAASSVLSPMDNNLIDPSKLRTREDVMALIENARKFATQVSTSELEAALTIVRTAESRLPASQLYLTAPALFYAAATQKMLGKFIDAAASLERILELYKSSGFSYLAENGIFHADVVFHQALLDLYQRQFVPAEDKMKQVYQMRRSALGDKHIHVAMIQYDLAIVMMLNGKWEDGVHILSEAAEVFNAKLGNDHIYSQMINDITKQIYELATTRRADVTTAAQAAEGFNS